VTPLQNTENRNTPSADGNAPWTFVRAAGTARFGAGNREGGSLCALDSWTGWMNRTPVRAIIPKLLPRWLLADGCGASSGGPCFFRDL